VCGQHHAPAAFTPGKDPVPIVQEAGWAPEPVWIGEENLAPSGFDPRTFQPVASRYTDWAIPAPYYEKAGHKSGRFGGDLIARLTTYIFLWFTSYLSRFVFGVITCSHLNLTTDRYDWYFIAIFLSHSTQMLDVYIKTGHERFFRHISSSLSTFSFYVDATTGVHKYKMSLARTTEFCTVTPSACGSSVWNLLHLTVLAPRILRWLLDFRKIFAPLRNSIEIAVEKLS
jgi:hypothetical protein